jgi:hypothetical protein
MSQLGTCPRCGAYVQPDWPTCKICGFDPDDPLTQGPMSVAPVVRNRPKVVDIVFGLVVFVALIAIGWGTITLGVYAWQHRSSPIDRQEYVAIPH